MEKATSPELELIRWQLARLAEVRRMGGFTLFDAFRYGLLCQRERVLLGLDRDRDGTPGAFRRAPASGQSRGPSTVEGD